MGNPFDFVTKFTTLFRMIRKNGGIRRSLYKLWRYDTLKEGRFVGFDTLGNRYFENNYYMFPRNRWVEIYDNAKWEYDGSMVSAEWYGWLHNKTDKVPCNDDAKRELYCDRWSKRWLLPHQENLSGTCLAYYPYGTTLPKFQVWDG